MQIYLETDRLILRRFTEDDADFLVDLDSDPQVVRYTSGGPATPRDVIVREHIPAYLGYYVRFAGYGFWVAIEKSTGAFLGWFHLRPAGEAPVDEPELGYRLKRSAWGKGYATEGSQALVDKAFADLGARSVVAFAYGENVASRRVMEKVGMRLVRTFKLTPGRAAGVSWRYRPQHLPRRRRRVRDHAGGMGTGAHGQSHSLSWAGLSRSRIPVLACTRRRRLGCWRNHGRTDGRRNGGQRRVRWTGHLAPHRPRGGGVPRRERADGPPRHRPR